MVASLKLLQLKGRSAADRLWAFGRVFSNDQMKPGARPGWNPIAINLSGRVPETSPKTIGFEAWAEL
jgi:hypothetical protein